MSRGAGDAGGAEIAADDAPAGSAALLADGARWIARFGGALRANGVPATVRDEIDAARALALVDRGDRDEVARALRIALKIRREAWPTFDSVFALYWAHGGVDLDEPAQTRPRAPREQAPPRLLSWDPPPARWRCCARSGSTPPPGRRTSWR